MPPIKDYKKETHNAKQKLAIIRFLYALAVIGLAIYISVANKLFTPYIQNIIGENYNSYLGGKVVVIANLLIVGTVLHPLYRIIKKAIEKSNQSESEAPPAGSHGMKEFSFSLPFIPIISTVTLDDTFIQLKIGLKEKRFLSSRLRNYYLLNQSSTSSLYITYEDENGKIIKWPLMNAGPGDSQLIALNDELLTRFPSKSLNNLSQKEAFKILKQPNRTLMIVIAFLIGILVVAGAIFLSLRH